MLSLVGSSESALAKDNAWTLLQTGKVSGEATVQVTGNAVKAHKKTAADTVLCTPPEFLVTLYNDKTKAYFVTPIEKWRARLLGSLGGALSGPEATPKRTSKSEVIAGIKTVCWTAINTDPLTVRTEKNSKGVPREVAAIDYWLADDIKVAPNIATVLSFFHGLPKLPGVPIRVKYRYTSGDTYTYVDTYSAKRINLDISSLKPPANYRKVNTDMEVFIDKKTEVLMEMFGDALKPEKK